MWYLVSDPCRSKANKKHSCTQAGRQDRVAKRKKLSEQTVQARFGVWHADDVRAATLLRAAGANLFPIAAGADATFGHLVAHLVARFVLVAQQLPRRLVDLGRDFGIRARVLPLAAYQHGLALCYELGAAALARAVAVADDFTKRALQKPKAARIARFELWPTQRHRRGAARGATGQRSSRPVGQREGADALSRIIRLNNTPTHLARWARCANLGALALVLAFTSDRFAGLCAGTGVLAQEEKAPGTAPPQPGVWVRHFAQKIDQQRFNVVCGGESFAAPAHTRTGIRGRANRGARRWCRWRRGGGGGGGRALPRASALFRATLISSFFCFKSTFDKRKHHDTARLVGCLIITI